MLTPEERQLNKMQNHGYENPTYKFFEQMNWGVGREPTGQARSLSVFPHQGAVPATLPMMYLKCNATKKWLDKQIGGGYVPYPL